MATAQSALGQEFFLAERRPMFQRSLTATFEFIRRKPLGAFGAFMLVLIMFVAAFSPWLAPDGVNEPHVGDQLQGPSSGYWLGTDANGRDMLTRIIYGAQVTALVGIGVVILVGFLSIIVGLISGYFGGTTDFIVQRFVDVWLSFPAIFLILTLVAVLNTSTETGFLGLRRGPNFGPDPQGGDWFWNTFPRTTIVTLALGVVLAGGASRVVRSAVIGIKVFPYVEAATVIGANNGRIILRHILPNIMATVIVLATVQLGVAILAEATLSFLGIGITNFPTWGQMLSGQTRTYVATNLHLALVPGFAIFFAVFGFNMLGDALRDVLDPRLRGSR